MFSQRVIQTEGMCHVNGKLKHGDRQALLKSPVEELGAVHWVGVDEKYFVAAAAIRPGDEGQKCSITTAPDPDGTISVMVLLSPRKIEPGQKTEYEMAGFFRPTIPA